MIFTINGVDYELDQHDLVDDCQIKIQPLDIRRPHYENFYIVGLVFLKRYRTIFDRLNDQVGIVK